MDSTDAPASGITRVGLADDQQLVRAGFAMVLSSQDEIDVAWEAADGEEAIQLAYEQPVDVVLMDVQMPVRDGISATREIVARDLHGPSGEATRVVMLTTFDDEAYVMGAVVAGASGFLLKDADPEDLIAAVRTVGDSAAVVSPAATARLLKRVRESNTGAGLVASGNREPEPPDYELIEPLTPREEEILVLIARGLSNAEIGEELFISQPTVKTHVGRVLAKTGLRDRVHAVLFAFRHGLVSNVDLLGGE